MGNFTLNIKKEYEFDGDKITVTMKRLSRVNALTITPHIEKASKGRSDGDTVSMSSSDTMEYMEAAGSILRDSVVDISGLYIEGVEVKQGTDKFFTVLDSVYFLNLIMMITNDLVAESFLKVEDEKKSGGQQGDNLKE